MCDTRSIQTEIRHATNNSNPLRRTELRSQVRNKLRQAFRAIIRTSASSQNKVHRWCVYVACASVFARDYRNVPRNENTQIFRITMGFLEEFLVLTHVRQMIFSWDSLLPCSLLRGPCVDFLSATLRLSPLNQCGGSIVVAGFTCLVWRSCAAGDGRRRAGMVRTAWVLQRNARSE